MLPLLLFALRFPPTVLVPRSRVPLLTADKLPEALTVPNDTLLPAVVPLLNTLTFEADRDCREIAPAS